MDPSHLIAQATGNQFVRTHTRNERRPSTKSGETMLLFTKTLCNKTCSSTRIQHFPKIAALESIERTPQMTVYATLHPWYPQECPGKDPRFASSAKTASALRLLRELHRRRLFIVLYFLSVFWLWGDVWLLPEHPWVVAVSFIFEIYQSSFHSIFH